MRVVLLLLALAVTWAAAQQRSAKTAGLSAVRTILPRSGNGAGALDMAQLYEDMVFDDVDGGTWKQGWEIEVDLAKEHNGPQQQLLEVHVVPFSHCDPGWINTYDEYFERQARSIISTVIEALTEDSRRRFVWAEISFFSRWWEDSRTTVQQRSEARALLVSGRLEFVTGGWVMNDEAVVPHWSSVMQLTEGHEWIRANVGFGGGEDGSAGEVGQENPNSHVRPTHGWSIDPFGHSPTMAMLNRRMGFDGMAINRIHYRVRKELDYHRNGEFMWRPTWRGVDDSEDDMFTHLFPFFIYDMPHTCGPTPAVCALYDFHKSSTPWGGRPEPVSNANVEHLATQLVEQWKKKASLFRTRNVMIPLGDDFRYQTMDEAHKLFNNHQSLHDYINEHPEKYGVSVKWSTFRDYASKVVKVPVKDNWPAVAPEVAPDANTPSFPVIRGDFFTFCDVRQECWSGYFSTRPFHKDLSRTTEAAIFEADMLLTSAALKGVLQSEELRTLTDKMTSARRSASLFLHHDGITGTSKQYVVKDYASLLQAARATAQAVSAAALTRLLSNREATRGSWGLVPATPSTGLSPFELSHLLSIDLGVLAAKCDVGDCVIPIVVSNPVEHETGVDGSRAVVVRVNCGEMSEASCGELVLRLSAQSLDGTTKLVSQVLPMWKLGSADFATDDVGSIRSTPSERQFDLAIVVPDVPAFGAATVAIALLPEPSQGTAVPSRLSVSATVGELTRHKFLGTTILQCDTSDEETFEVSNYRYTMTFDSGTGLLRSLRVHAGDLGEVGALEKYVTYSDSGGAYIFVPGTKDVDGASPIPPSRAFVRAEGPVFHEVITEITDGVFRRMRLPAHTRADSGCQEVHPEISHFFSIVSNAWKDKELVVRFQTSLDTTAGFSHRAKSGGLKERERPSFITDLNALTFQRRRTRPSRTKQANFYPATALVAVEDENSTKEEQHALFALLLGGPAAVSSQCNGCFEVILDRRVTADDNKGLGEGVIDNVPTHLRSRLIVEASSRRTDTELAPWWPSPEMRGAMRTLDRPMSTYFAAPVGAEGSSPGKARKDWIETVQLSTQLLGQGSVLAEDIELVSLRLREGSTSSSPVGLAQTVRHHLYGGTTHSVPYNSLVRDIVQGASKSLSLQSHAHTLTFLSTFANPPADLDAGEYAAHLLTTANDSGERVPTSVPPRPRVNSDAEKTGQSEPVKPPPRRVVTKLPHNMVMAQRGRDHSEVFAVSMMAIATVFVPIMVAAGRRRLAKIAAAVALAAVLWHWLFSHRE